MYDKFFGFTGTPFRRHSDPRFFYSTSSYAQAYADILNNIHQHQALIFLTGAAGTGKTLLLRQCAASFAAQRSIRVVQIKDTYLSFENILDQFCEQLNFKLTDQDYGQKAHTFQGYLYACLRQGKTAVLLIDDAHKLASGVVRSLMQLAQTPKLDLPLFQMIFFGLPGLNTKFRDVKTVRLSLNPLKMFEIDNFIQWQLKQAGCKRQNIFSPQALQRISWYSRGRPRTINTLCDTALFFAYLESNHVVSADLIEQAAQRTVMVSVPKFPTVIEGQAIQAVETARREAPQLRIVASADQTNVEALSDASKKSAWFKKAQRLQT